MWDEGCGKLGWYRWDGTGKAGAWERIEFREWGCGCLVRARVCGCGGFCVLLLNRTYCSLR